MHVFIKVLVIQGWMHLGLVEVWTSDTCLLFGVPKYFVRSW